MSQVVGGGKVVTIAYTLTVDGEQIEQIPTSDAIEYLHGAENIVPGLEAALEGKTVGDRVQVTVPPSEGYGEYSDDDVETFGHDELPDADQLEVGMTIVVEDDEGYISEAVVKSVDVSGVVLDFNPPLAGETLHFDVQIIDIRDADEEELDQGIPHSLELDDEDFEDEDFDEDDGNGRR